MLVVGFDLDMTLVDSRPGIRASFEALTAETGVAVDVDVVLSRIGPKLESELAHWFPADAVADAAVAYRRHYWDLCVTGTELLPGARAAVDAVQTLGGTVIVVTAKAEPHARRCLDAVGLTIEDVAGHVHGAEKAVALTAAGAHVYVGDTAADIEAAIGAHAVAVGVTTGPHTRADLESAGANVVLATLEAFPTWLEQLPPT